MGVEHQLSRNLSLFLSGRNIANSPQNQLISSTVYPLYGQFIRAEEYGIQWSVGVKGSF